MILVVLISVVSHPKILLVTTSTPIPQSHGRPYSQQDWQAGYRSLYNEFDYWIDDVEGEIPADLTGTLFRNGPGLLDVGGTRIHHPFDGDGMICAIAFKDGKAHFRNRYVRTEGYCAEQAAETILYRGVFGTQKPGGVLANAFDFRLKNIANTNVIYWGDRLLALWEAAKPHRLSPYTLETVGVDHLDGVLEEGDSFAAHPWVDPQCAFTDGEPCLVNFAVQPGLSTQISLFEFYSDGKLRRRYAHNVPGFAFIHDFAITPNYAIFFQNPVAFNPLPFALGLRGPGECITFQPEKPTRVIVVPRQPSGEAVHLETECGFVFHHANAFEKDGKVYVDSVSYKGFPEVEPDSDFRQVDFDRVPEGQLWRFELDLGQKTVARSLLESRCCEFPQVNPCRAGRPYRYAYLGAAEQPRGNAPLQSILKADLETGDRHRWSAAPQGFVGEPVFVPRPDGAAEDDGWVMAMVFNASHGCSELVVLDGQNLEAIATLRLKHHVPYGLHGNFVSEYFGPAS
ncbi:MAG: carotenoid oxygenase family protein [Elainellaceae cyanobacterium]